MPVNFDTEVLLRKRRKSSGVTSTLLGLRHFKTLEEESEDLSTAPCIQDTRKKTCITKKPPKKTMMVEIKR